MKSAEQIQKMIEAVKRTYADVPATSMFGGDNAGECAYLMSVLEKVIAEAPDKFELQDWAEREFALAPEPEGKHYEAGNMLDWVASDKPDEMFEGDWGYEGE